uniref:Movement protein TGBp3 n=1 Tax=Garlic common latent virus TaxID=47900 RepID=A0A6M2YTH7_9VIRU|nr:TGB3 [Garlic common latent virus]QED43230.1 TGB3 [Garlic common latent virus]
MRENARLTLWACLGLLSSFIVLNIFSAFINTDCGCSIAITGESVTIRGCKFTPEFIEYAKTLEVAKIW